MVPEVAVRPWHDRLGTVRHGTLLRYCEAQGWIASAGASLMTGVGSRRIAPDHDRALSRERVEDLLTCETIPLRDRLLWRMLYETAERAAEILGLDVADLDMSNRSARVRRKRGPWMSSSGRPGRPGCSPGTF